MREGDEGSEAGLWLRYAEEDLRAARWVLQGDDVPPRHACFLCQQAAEKAVKAVLISAGVDFPKAHDIELLRRLVPAGLLPQLSAVDLSGLTQWAVEARYPTDSPDATPEEARRAVAQAEEVFQLVARALAGQSGSMETA